jgi:hypothetical protein
MRLTANNVRALELPAGKTERIFFDSELPGFGLRIRSGGSKTWCVQYKFGTKHRRIVLGSLSTLDPGKARETAKDLLAAVRLGRDPAGDRLEARAKTAETFGALLPRFLVRQRARLKPRSYEEVERHLLVHSKSLHSRPVTELDRRAVAVRLSEIADRSGPTAANSVRASLSTCFNWMLREGLIETNPAAFTNKAIEGGARERVLTNSELAEIWNALPANHYGAIVKLLTFTAVAGKKSLAFAGQKSISITLSSRCRGNASRITIRTRSCWRPQHSRSSPLGQSVRWLMAANVTWCSASERREAFRPGLRASST